MSLKTCAFSKVKPVDPKAPGIVARSPVNRPLNTGIFLLDIVTPVGRGQRQLIIGNRKSGKTSIALDTIINHRNLLKFHKNSSGEVIRNKKKLYCIYVAIGQKAAKTNTSAIKLLKRDAIRHTFIVFAGASDTAGSQYMAAFTGTALGEGFRDLGRDALVVYDDLSKHAVSYRQIALVLRRPVGREAYPGDIFYLHARLLERSCQLNEIFGGGSLTALPIVEILNDDITTYIPTNIISITDGQIYLNSELFYSGFRPAIDTGLSVSRVGSKALVPVLRKLAPQIKHKYAKYKELLPLRNFDSDLDSYTTMLLDNGDIMSNFFIQKNLKPLPIGTQLVLLYIILLLSRMIQKKQNTPENTSM